MGAQPQSYRHRIEKVRASAVVWFDVIQKAGDLDSIHDNWDALAQADPLWAALEDPALKDGGWRPAEFLASGEREIDTVLSRCAVTFKSAALDFGCGAGRLTQALAKRFDEAHGVDISEAMLRTARELVSSHNVTLHLNQAPNLELFPNDRFGFVYSSIVLQHMRRDYQTAYIREFLRVTRTGGLVVFQIPDRYIERQRVRALIGRARWRLAIRSRLRQRRLLGVERAGPASLTEMHALPEAKVRRIVERTGCQVIDVALTNSTELDFNGNLRYLSAEPEAGWVSKQYTVRV